MTQLQLQPWKSSHNDHLAKTLIWECGTRVTLSAQGLATVGATRLAERVRNGLPRMALDPGQRQWARVEIRAICAVWHGRTCLAGLTLPNGFAYLRVETK
eukprot:2710144-Amphidinium_carterae.2